MNPEDPESAQHIVTEYARLLEHQLTADDLPASLDTLPYAKPVIKAAIRTSVQVLASTGQLTPDLRAFLETAYVSLADYLAPESGRLVGEIARSATNEAQQLKVEFSEFVQCS
jgi:hypothetical protein